MGRAPTGFISLGASVMHHATQKHVHHAGQLAYFMYATRQLMHMIDCAWV